MRVTFFIFLAALGLDLRAQAGSSPLLNRAAAPWLAESERWAFTARVKQFAGSDVKEVRVERYDPSKPGAARWELVSVDGQPPTPERLLAWQKAKARKYLQGPKVFADNFDFDNVRIVQAQGGFIRYALPLKSNHAVLFPLEHIELTVTVNRATHAIDEVKASIDQPFRTALGLARLIELNFDLKLSPRHTPVAVVTPADARPEGPARAVIARLGERIEYEWSDFHRVAPAPAKD
jgi:hypothetical protein